MRIKFHRAAASRRLIPCFGLLHQGSLRPTHVPGPIAGTLGYSRWMGHLEVTGMLKAEGMGLQWEIWRGVWILGNSWRQVLHQAEPKKGSYYSIQHKFNLFKKAGGGLKQVPFCTPKR